ncbi:unnamed protein product [Rotaria magnacalcarata]|uniref:Uncharacterized protein n=2 Tax=Rotaria magnacalcarata TaxID=392030 RepID=A0A819P7R5_9BILA|nr:unnamed protein product [Rotaria magnacalcarata]CAF4005603.1 unnamed protein product [Rotaria magnacalcarata]
MDLFEYQIWRLVINGQREPHLRLNGTDANVLTVSDKIAERCFNVHLTKPDAHEGIGHSTPLTYYLLAYDASLRGIHGLFSNEDIFICTQKKLSSIQIFQILPHQIQTPMLQLILFECDESTMLQLVRSMHNSEFRQAKTTTAESIFDYCNRPVLTVSYSDMNDIEETNVAGMARLVRALSMIELHRQAEDISGARQNSILLHSDYNVFDMKASAEELDLMRKILKQNLKQTKGNHRHGLIGP